MSILLRGNEVVAVAALCSLCSVFIAYADYLGMKLIYRRHSWTVEYFYVSLDFKDFLKVTKIGGNLAKAMNDTDRIDGLVLKSFGQGKLHY